MDSRRLAAIAAVGAAVVALLYFRRSAPSRSATASTSSTTSAEAARDRSVTRATSDNAAASAKAEPSAGPHLDRARADEMREELHRMFAEAGPLWAQDDEPPEASTGPLSATGRPLEPMPELDSGLDDAGMSKLAHYIKDRMHEDFFPLASQCYGAELEKDPTLRLKVILKYRIVGDKSVGGVVDSASIEAAEGSTAQSASFSQCMVQSMMSVSFGAPPDSQHETSVTYPIVFTPDDDDGGG